MSIFSTTETLGAILLAFQVHGPANQKVSGFRDRGTDKPPLPAVMGPLSAS